MPWKALLKLIAPRYPKAGRPGRQPYVLETMCAFTFFSSGTP